MVLRVLLVQLREPCSPRSRMDDHAVAEPDVLPRLDRQAAVLCLVVEEIAHAERIDRVQPVPAGMPIGRMPRIARMIHHHDAHFFSIELARVVHPFRPLAPDVRLPLAALGIDQFPGSRRRARLLLGRRFLERRRHAHGERTFLGVAEDDLVDRREVEVEIDDAEHRDARRRSSSGFPSAAACRPASAS